MRRFLTLPRSRLPRSSPDAVADDSTTETTPKATPAAAAGGRPRRDQGVPARAHRPPRGRHGRDRTATRGVLRARRGGRLRLRDAARGEPRRGQRARQGLQAGFTKANPAYEEMEGVVAGVPSLADYDVIIDAGADASDPENAVPFSIETGRRNAQAARQLQLPGRDRRLRHRPESSRPRA